MVLRAFRSVAVTGEQIIYSITNFAVTIVCARAMSVTEFGNFALFSAVVILIIGLQRALITEPLMISFNNNGSKENNNNQLSAYLLYSIIFSTISSIVIIICFAIFLKWGEYLILIPLSVALFLNDYSRFAYILNEKFSALLANTLAVSAVQIGGMLVFQQKMAVSAQVAAAVWTGGAVVGVFFHVIFLRTNLKSAWRLLSLIRTNLKLGSQFAVDYFLGIATTQGVLLAATVVTGPGAAAALRGADSLVGPVRMLLQSAPALVLPRSDAIMRSQGGVVRTIVLLILSFSGVVAVWDIIVLNLPDAVGVKLLGASWTVVRPILPWVLLALFLNVVVAFSALGLKLMRRGDVLAKSRLKLLPFGFALSIGGAFYAGALGGAIGALMTSVIAASIWFLGFVRIAKGGE